MARHGLGYSTAQWVTRLASLVNPLVVGTFLGAAGVGYVAFAQRLVDTVAFAQRGAYRLGMVAMSRVSNEEESRLRYSVEEGSRLQLLALGVPLACFGLAAHWVVPAIFGHQWLRAVPLYGLLALFAMLNASGLIQMTFLYSRGRNMAVTGAASIQVVVLAVSSIFLVKRMGINGFGVASLLALVDLIYMDRMVRKFFAFSYKRILPWVVILAPPVLFPLVEPPWGFLLLAPIVLVLLPGMRVEIKRIFDLIRSSLARPRPLPEAPAVVGRAP
jgi:PST family polysaccharide transporter